MSNLRPAKSWKPGQSGNPSGKPKGLLTKDQVMSVLGKFSALTKTELQEVLQNPKSTMLEIMVASVMVKAAQTGDSARLDFLWNRSIGKVKEEIEHSGGTDTKLVITLPDNGRSAKKIEE